jgi:hypothetical protein
LLRELITPLAVDGRIIRNSSSCFFVVPVITLRKLRDLGKIARIKQIPQISIHESAQSAALNGEQE